MANSSTRPAPAARAVHAPRSSPDRGATARARLDAALRPFVLGSASPAHGAQMTERRVAATARDAAAAVLPLLGEPRPSAHRVRGLVRPVLTCRWSDFDASYAAALDALLALPPAVRGVHDPAWDEDLTPEHAAPRQWVNDGRRWTPPDYGADAVGPGGVAGRVVRRGAQSVLITRDGRPVRLRAQCDCAPAERGARALVPFEHVHLRRDGSIVDVFVADACGTCRAPIG